MKTCTQGLGFFLNLPVFTRMNTMTAVRVLLILRSYWAPRAENMPNDPSTQQNKDDDDKRIPRTNWNSESSVVGSVGFHKLLSSYLLGVKEKRTNTNSLPSTTQLS